MDFVLIPGAWMGAWVWEPVTRKLRALGHRVYPLTLSGLADGDADVSGVGLGTHVEDVLRVLEAEDLRGAIVVGHSYSGIVAGQVADRAPGCVARTVYVDAFVPRNGRSMLDAFDERQREDELRQISENGGLWPPPGVEDVAREPDLSDDQARWLAERLVGHPGRTVSEPAVLRRPLTEQRATYVACAFESPEDVAALRGEPGWTFRELEAGHWPMVSLPEELAALLVEAAGFRTDGG
jgi:pimeloyl-ACP methyl ester carboxylesterase